MDLEDLNSSSLHDLWQFTASNLKFIPCIQVIYSCSHICRCAGLGCMLQVEAGEQPSFSIPSCGPCWASDVSRSSAQCFHCEQSDPRQHPLVSGSVSSLSLSTQIIEQCRIFEQVQSLIQRCGKRSSTLFLGGIEKLPTKEGKDKQVAELGITRNSHDYKSHPMSADCPLNL